MDEPIIIWQNHIDEDYESCSFFIWYGRSCLGEDSCSCVRTGYILEGGLKDVHNYGYVGPFEWEFR